jgi:DNA (cytosine-5)-methyltransferase 1
MENYSRSALKIDLRFSGSHSWQIGDTVIMPIGHGGKEKPPDLPDPRQIPSTATIQEYFWFAKIIYINREYETAHVQWFWHSSTTAMQELSNPQELFLAELCDTIDLRCVAGKAIVHDKNPSTSTLNINHGEFFYKYGFPCIGSRYYKQSLSRFTYDSVLSTYTDIDREGIKIANCNAPPDNCPVCLLVSGKDYQSFGQKLPTGVAYHGVNFHIYDFALIRANKGPCHIGYIIDISIPGKSQRHLPITIVVKLLGRVSSLAGILPRNIVKDEVSCVQCVDTKYICIYLSPPASFIHDR